MSFVDVLEKYGLMILSIVITGISLVIAWVKAKRTGNSRGMLALVEQIPSLVTTAESLFGSGRGPAKLDYVLTQLRLYALQQNVKVNVEDLTAQINSVVETTKNVNVNMSQNPSPADTSTETGANVEYSQADTQNTLNI